MSGTAAQKTSPLPPTLAPLGLRRVEAAAFVGVSPSLFDQMIADGRMPRPKRYRGRVIWDRRALEQAFACLPEDDEAKPVSSNPWDAVSNV